MHDTTAMLLFDLLDITGFLAWVKYLASSTWHLHCAEQIYSKIVLECRLQDLAQ